MVWAHTVVATENPIRKDRFTDEHAHEGVREADAGGKVLEICRRHGTSKSALHRWRAKCRGLELQETKRLKSEDENRRLERLVADQLHEIGLLKDVVWREW